MYEEIVEKITTKEDVDRLSEVMDNLRVGRYKPGGVKDRQGSDWGEVLEASCPKDSGAREAFWQGLTAELKKLKTIKLTVAVDPEARLVERVSNWIKTNLGRGVIVEFETRRGILGGAVVEFEGRFMDATVRKRLKEYFRNYRVELS